MNSQAPHKIQGAGGTADEHFEKGNFAVDSPELGQSGVHEITISNNKADGLNYTGKESILAGKG